MRHAALIILIDALGWKTIENRPFLDDLILTRCPLRTVLGFSSGAEPSILTGKTPAQHGRWTMYKRASSSSPFGLARWLALYPPALPAAHRIRRFLSWWVRSREKVAGYFDLYEVPLSLLPNFDLCERGNIFDVGGIPEAPTLFDRLSDQGIPFRSWSWRTAEAQNWRDLESAIDRGEPGYYFLYTPALDALQHSVGTQAPAVGDLVADYERRIRAIHDLAVARGLRPVLHIFADHGMKDTLGTADLIAAVRATGLRMTRDYLAFYDSTMGRFWFFHDDARDRVTAALRAIPHGRVLDDAELAREGVLFGDRRYGETIFLMNPGWQIEPSFMGSRAPRAMHGFHPDDAWSDAAFLSNHAFENPPRDIRDLLPILLAAAQRGEGA
ncbi:MAG: alkaline phosphatase family protein [bacterium]